jgi:hypothetical protein
MKKNRWLPSGVLAEAPQAYSANQRRKEKTPLVTQRGFSLGAWQ